MFCYYMQHRKDMLRVMTEHFTLTTLQALWMGSYVQETTVKFALFM